MKTRKSLCLFVMALAVFALLTTGGCGSSSSSSNSFVDTPTSGDVTPNIPTTSGDNTPAAPVAPPTSGDNMPTPMPTPPTSGDTRPDMPTPPTVSPDYQPTPPTDPANPTTPVTSPDTQPVAPTPVTSPDTTPTTDDTTSDDTSGTTTDDDSGGTTTTGETYSTTSEGNALTADGQTVTYSNITVTKTGDASGSSDGQGGFDWTGTNAAVLAKNGAKLTISGSSTRITSNAKGGNAVFSYGGSNSNNSNNSGDGTTVTISDATITTTGSNSGGIMTTGGGVMNASNLTITTSGGSSAAIRSDSGGGTVTVTGGTYTTNGTGSPAIYSTAAISVYGADLVSTNSQGVVIEGGNSVTLDTVNINANHATLNGKDTMHQAVMIYQSMSGDASGGSSSFSMTDGSITNTIGDIFHVTNVTTTIALSGVNITNNDSSGAFLRASSDAWGSSGSNGGKVTLNASGQDINGDIVVDSVSTLTMNLKDSSNFTGAVNSANAGTVTMTIEAGSTWTLTGNSYVDNLDNKGTINKGSYTLYVDGAAQ